MASIRLKEQFECNTRTATAVTTSRSLHCDITMDNHSAIIDEPPERGGEDGGATPLLHFAASFASCQAIQVAKVAQAMRIEYGQIKIDVTLDTARSVGRENDTRIIRFVGAKMVINVESSASDAKLARLETLAIDRCPIGALLDDAAVETAVVWNNLPLSESKI